MLNNIQIFSERSGEKISIMEKTMDVKAIKENINILGVEMKIFLSFINFSDKNGRTCLKKTDLAKVFKTTAQTVGKYIKNLVDVKILKYKYSGEAMLNPEFYYVGDAGELDAVLEAYKNFKSDM